MGESGRPKLGVLLLELDQLAQQIVVLGIRDLRIVEDVVAVVVVLELPAQLRRALRPAGDASAAHSPADGAPWLGEQGREVPARHLFEALQSVSSKCSGVTEIMPASIAAKSVPVLVVVGGLVP